jgi:chromate transport protein ChrA
LGIAQTPSLTNLFVLGLVAGSLSFGGAYTAIPFIQVEAVLKGAWLSQSVFIDCIAIGNVLPAPLVIFATFVGFQGGLAEGGLGNAFVGAIIITLGMFSPCFLFTIAGHSLLEKLIRNKVCLSITLILMVTAPDLLQLLSSFFDGLCGAVIGVIAIIAAQILQTSIEGVKRQAEQTSVNAAIDRLSQNGPAAVLYVLALATLYKFSSKYSPLLLLVCSAIAGQFIFIS